jgi:hypothetical protein
VLLPKTKYEDLLRQEMEGESVQKPENERRTNISTPSDNKDGSEDLDPIVMEENKQQKMDKPTAYITMKPENGRQTNNSTPSDDKDGSEDLDPSVMEENKQQKMNKPATYITMKPTKFAKQTQMNKNKKWMKFKM